MKSKLIMGIFFALLLTGMLALAFNIQPVEASPDTITITIRADGSVFPIIAPISTVDNVTYELTGDITPPYDGIAVERDNIVVDGAGYMVQGANITDSIGMDLTGTVNVTIKNMKIGAFNYGVAEGSNSNIVGNHITNNTNGIRITWGSSNISGNNITNNTNHGIALFWCSGDTTVSGNNITNNGGWGVLLYGSRNETICGNIIANNYWGIVSALADSDYNTIFGNEITNCGRGISLTTGCDFNIIHQNNITNNEDGIYVGSSCFYNSIYHNNLIDNAQQVHSGGEENIWDDGYPSGGNYWNDYAGNDSYSGPHQNEAGSDGIGDTAYTIDENNQDNFPLMNPWTPPDYTPPQIFVLSPRNTTYATTPVPLTFTINEPTSWIGYSLDGQANITVLGNTTLTGLSEGMHNVIVYANDTSGNQGLSTKIYFTYTREIPIKEGENATIEGNVTVTDATATANALHFHASGPSGSTGWINVTFPKVNTTEITVFVNNFKLTPPPFPTVTGNETHYFIYFEFTLSTHDITILYEMPVGGISIPVNKLEVLAPYIGLTILLAVAVTTVAYVKKRKRNIETNS